MFDFSPIQIVIVLAIALLIFGASRLPEIGRNLGRGLREFKGAIVGDSHEAPSPTTADRRDLTAPDDVTARRNEAA